ncbi:hypothetical protein [Tranquillimonas rosea]|uniref:hypothetical protein n=1 Tax=Tranquillimonas rosea TaxID=641238 RepID=UPI003BACD56E
MSTSRPPVFLERQSYRRRRLADAARLLPLAGAVAFVFPVFWSGGDEAAARPATADAGLYVFAVWLGLIVVAALLSGRLVRHGEDADQDG